MAYRATAKDRRMGGRDFSVCDLSWRSDWAGSADAKCKLINRFVNPKACNFTIHVPAVFMLC